MLFLKPNYSQFLTFINISIIHQVFDGKHNKEYNQYDETKFEMQHRNPGYNAKVLCFCTKENKSINVLDISNCNITTEGTR